MNINQETENSIEIIEINKKNRLFVILIIVITGLFWPFQKEISFAWREETFLTNNLISLSDS
jgi:hypothetical protein